MGHRDRGAFHTSTLPECTQESAALQCLKSKADSPQLLHVFLKTHCCFGQKLHRGIDYKMHFQSIAWWTQGPRISSSCMPKTESGQKTSSAEKGTAAYGVRSEPDVWVSLRRCRTRDSGFGKSSPFYWPWLSVCECGWLFWAAATRCAKMCLHMHVFNILRPKVLHISSCWTYGGEGGETSVL